MTQKERSLLLVGGNLKNPNPHYNRSKTAEKDAKIDQEFNTLTKNGLPTSKIHKDFTLQKKLFHGMNCRKHKMPDYLVLRCIRRYFRNSLYSASFFRSIETKTVIRASRCVHLLISVFF